MDACHPISYTPWWAVSTLRPLPPVRPSVPVSRDVVGPAVPEAPEAAEEMSTVPNGTVNIPLEPVWQALLDVTVWRSRPWWLRLAASIVVRRLGP
jgi:hypothetical protein